MVEIHHKKISYINHIYFKISKKLNKVYNDLKIKFSNFQINLIQTFLMCLMLELLQLLLIFYSLGVTFFLWNLWFQFFFHFLNLGYFFKNFPTKIAKLRKLKTKKICWLCVWGWGVIQVFEPNISPNIFFPLLKNKNYKNIFLS